MAYLIYENKKTILSIISILFLILCLKVALLPYVSFSTLIDLAFNNDPISTYNENYIRQQKLVEGALFWRLELKKDNGTIQKLSPLIYMSTNYKNSIKMWKISSIAIKLYPKDKEWKSKYLISKLATQKQLNLNEQNELIDYINSLSNTKYDINIIICGEKNFAGTTFLEHYRDKFDKGEGRRYICNF